MYAIMCIHITTFAQENKNNRTKTKITTYRDSEYMYNNGTWGIHYM